MVQLHGHVAAEVRYSLLLTFVCLHNMKVIVQFAAKWGDHIRDMALAVVKSRIPVTKEAILTINKY